MTVISVVGLTGSGKSEASKFFKTKGFPVIRFGDITIMEIEKQGLEVNEKNEKMVREGLRKELGMAVFAVKNLPRLEKGLKTSDIVVADGLYSWEEYLFLKEKFGEKLILLAIYASPKTRYARLADRKERPLTEEEAKSRDKAEIENMSKAGPIAIADYTINNEGTLEELDNNLENFLKGIKEL